MPLMPHDVFISHSSDDVAVAGEACAPPEDAGALCWIAPRDILPVHSGSGGAIVQGCDGMLWSNGCGPADPSPISLPPHCGCDSE